MLIDSHAHIYDDMLLADGGAEGIVSRMESDGLEYIMCVGCDLPTSETSVRLAERYERVYAIIGVHPYDADKVDDECIERLRALASSKKAVAIGEIGLDFHFGGENRSAQVSAMIKQYELAKELDMPTVYHIRDGFGEFYEFAKARDFSAGGVLHCFSGSAETAEYYLSKGFYISFSGTVTYKNAVNLVRAASVVPLERLLAETDSPYLTPSPMRGKVNKPAYVSAVVDKLAEIKGVSPSEMAEITSRNAKRVFGIE